MSCELEASQNIIPKNDGLMEPVSLADCEQKCWSNNMLINFLYPKSNVLNWMTYDLGGEYIDD